MITLTGFADEISPELETQLDVLHAEGISHLELRSVWKTNVLKLNDDEMKHIKKQLGERGIKVSSIGSPIGKIKISDDFAPHLEDMKRAIRLADYFETSNIRIFSFHTPKGEDPWIYENDVMERMHQLVRLAEEAGVTLLHENEKGIFGDTGERCLQLLSKCSSPNFQCAFDPANYVQCGVKPMADAYPLVESYISYIHVKDALFESGKVVPAGKGDGELRELVSALKERGYSGFMSLEPHLAAAGEFEGVSGGERFIAASRALKQLLLEAQMDWQ